MASRQDDQKRVTELAQAAAHLRDTGKPQLADAVDFVLTPEGFAFLKRQRESWLIAEGHLHPNFAMAVPRSVREEIYKNAKAQGADLAQQATQALNEFLAGTYTPFRPARAARGSNVEMVNMNIRVEMALRSAADAAGKERAEEFGWAPRASHVITSWLVQHFTKASQEQSKK